VRIAGAGQADAVFDTSHTFERVVDAYDLALMKGSRIIAVGAGGAADWLEQLARAGVGQFIMIDPDVVSETNLATQQTYRRDIGRPKVDCIAERIRDINPTAKAIALQKSLDDLADEDIRRLALDPIDGRLPGRTVICGLTDNFFAQARVNRLALQLGLPSLCAQVYREGRGAEITFTYPGITPACHRCILSSRYRYFLEQGQNNDVTSHGTPIFATTRLNAIKGFVMLALLHHGSAHPRWGSMLSRIGNRNLIQIRMAPDFAETMKMTVFNRVFEQADQSRLFFDEVVWLPQKEESPETGYPYHCPDCGGTGDLRKAIGTIQDTKLVQENGSVQITGNHKVNACAQRAIEAYRQNGRTT
jgi:molybdopterin/thiamine biosynthesis adenylyltransferase